MENKKTTTLTLREVYELESEISGLVFGEKTIIEGLLNQKISIVTKYHLTKLVSKLKEEKTLMDQVKNDLIKKFGEEKEDGSVSIEPFLVTKSTDHNDEEVEQRVQNPKFIEFSQDYSKLLEQNKDLEHYAFTIDDLSKVETKDNYTVLFKLID